MPLRPRYGVNRICRLRAGMEIVLRADVDNPKILSKDVDPLPCHTCLADRRRKKILGAHSW